MRFQDKAFGLILGGALANGQMAIAGDNPSLGVDLSLPSLPQVPDKGHYDNPWSRSARRGLGVTTGDPDAKPSRVPARTPSRTFGPLPSTDPPPPLEARKTRRPAHASAPSVGASRPDYPRVGVSCPSYVSDLLHGRSSVEGRDPARSGLECFRDLGLISRPSSRPAQPITPDRDRRAPIGPAPLTSRRRPR
jgi:hypothetical protein